MTYFLHDLVIFLQGAVVLSQSTSQWIISGSGLSQRGWMINHREDSRRIETASKQLRGVLIASIESKSQISVVKGEL